MSCMTHCFPGENHVREYSCLKCKLIMEKIKELEVQAATLREVRQDEGYIETRQLEISPRRETEVMIETKAIKDNRKEDKVNEYSKWQHVTR